MTAGNTNPQDIADPPPPDTMLPADFLHGVAPDPLIDAGGTTVVVRPDGTLLDSPLTL